MGIQYLSSRRYDRSGTTGGCTNHHHTAHIQRIVIRIIVQHRYRDAFPGIDRHRVTDSHWRQIIIDFNKYCRLTRHTTRIIGHRVRESVTRARSAIVFIRNHTRCRIHTHRAQARYTHHRHTTGIDLALDRRVVRQHIDLYRTTCHQHARIIRHLRCTNTTHVVFTLQERLHLSLLCLTQRSIKHQQRRYLHIHRWTLIQIRTQHHRTKTRVVRMQVVVYRHSIDRMHHLVVQQHRTLHQPARSRAHRSAHKIIRTTEPIDTQQTFSLDMQTKRPVRRLLTIRKATTAQPLIVRHQIHTAVRRTQR